MVESRSVPMPRFAPDTFVERLRELRGKLERGYKISARGSHYVASTGQCAATALVVQLASGGRLISTTINGTSHWFNRIIVGTSAYDVDLTGDQFGFDAVRVAPANLLHTATRIRPLADVHAETIARAVQLARRSGLQAVADALPLEIQALQRLLQSADHPERCHIAERRGEDECH